ACPGIGYGNMLGVMTAEHTAPQPSLNTRVGMEIRALMGRYGITQTQLADVLGVNQGQVSKRLRSVIPFTLPEIELIASFFRISAAQLLGYAEGPQPDGPDGGQVVDLRQRRNREAPPTGLEPVTL
ncbi:MAG: helix-turn-helix domain-containing protein, partial [Propionibacteriaceae bacterium]|nr:helix-turn-helix domain-containing protein [Propionibacteriaceae bacterium]